MQQQQHRWHIAIEKVYDQIHLALWAGLCAFLIFFALFVEPHLPAAQAKYERLVAAQNEAEHEFYCKRWGMQPGTAKYDECMTDLLQLRRSVEKQVLSDLNFSP